MGVFILAEPLSHYISLRLCFSIALESIYGDHLIDAHYILYNFATMHDLIILDLESYILNSDPNIMYIVSGFIVTVHCIATSCSIL